jgi:hypothetical protein
MYLTSTLFTTSDKCDIILDYGTHYERILSTAEKHAVLEDIECIIKCRMGELIVYEHNVCLFICLFVIYLFILQWQQGDCIVYNETVLFAHAYTRHDTCMMSDTCERRIG